MASGTIATRRAGTTSTTPPVYVSRMPNPCALFADAARKYVTWVESGGETCQRELVRSLQRHLLNIYASGLDLRESDYADAVDVDDVVTRSYNEWRLLVRELGVPFNYYYCIAGPLVDDRAKIVANELLDDLADIAMDLEEGLLLMQAGHEDSAAFHWAQNRFHWGQHAIEALSVLDDWSRWRD